MRFLNKTSIAFQFLSFRLSVLLILATIFTGFGNGCASAQPSGGASQAIIQTAMAQTINSSRIKSVKLVDEKNLPIHPLSILQDSTRIYLLGIDGLWVADSNLLSLKDGDRLAATGYFPTNGMINHIPVQEFNNFVFAADGKSLVILDKAGNLFRFSPETRKWDLLRAASLFRGGSPDPDFIDLCSLAGEIVVLDPERNELWAINESTRAVRPFFKEIMPWLVKPGDANFGNALCIAADEAVYVLKMNGIITRCLAPAPHKYSWEQPCHPRINFAMRPSRLATAHGAPLFITERENNRVITYDKKSGRSTQFLFPANSDLRGMAPSGDGFWIINGDTLNYRCLAFPDKPQAHYQAKKIDSRLTRLSIPVAGARLPRHMGVYPGARRLYRYGVHEGVDFFKAANCHLLMGTPIQAAGDGTVERVDSAFTDMNARQFGRIMQECALTHKTSARNEDLFRGCQVWIDHGNGLITRYAHLNEVNKNLHVGQRINKGELLGYAGVSGTGENLPGRAKQPHLHFEIWLDGHYLGYGLTPQETLGVYEDVFRR